jgi:hypothetical protein
LAKTNANEGLLSAAKQDVRVDESGQGSQSPVMAANGKWEARPSICVGNFASRDLSLRSSLVPNSVAAALPATRRNTIAWCALRRLITDGLEGLDVSPKPFNTKRLWTGQHSSGHRILNPFSGFSELLCCQSLAAQPLDVTCLPIAAHVALYCIRRSSFCATCAQNAPL